MRQRNLAGFRGTATTHQRGRGRGVVWRSKRGLTATDGRERFPRDGGDTRGAQDVLRCQSGQ